MLIYADIGPLIALAVVLFGIFFGLGVCFARVIAYRKRDGDE